MTTLRELKGLRIKDAIGKELAVQRAVWNWALYDDYIKPREVARKHGAAAAREYIDKAENASAEYITSSWNRRKK